MDANTLRVLQWPEILALLASNTATALGRELATSSVPSTHREVISRLQQQTREARYLLETDNGMPFGGITDCRELIARASLEMQLTPQDLLDVAQAVASSLRLKTYLARRADHCPLLAEVAGNMLVPAQLERRIAECIAPNAEVLDSASVELGNIRRTRRTTQGRLQTKLNSILASDRFKPLIQEPIITTREGRYCIPVKSEFRNQFGGIVHDASASGATAFVEPGACVELGNELKSLELREAQEISRILGRLSALVGASGRDLLTTLGHVASLDLANASALLALDQDATEPIWSDDSRLTLRRARHPLLSGEVVPIDIEVGGTNSVLLITGPNTGGKTVALKTAGLLVLMAQAGLQIPASPDSSLPLYDSLFADIGDEQDIHQSLSTFSAHLRNIIRIMHDLGDRSLVLLDEVGAGTDPAEGAALAKAILTELQSRGATVMATTHYGELKEYAYSRPGIENASVEFDRETLRPTYRLLLGVPGSSHALYIAERLGLPERVSALAREALEYRAEDSAEVLRVIEESRRRALTLQDEATASARQASRAQADYEARLREITEVQRTVRSRAEEEARLVLRRASERADNLIEELRKVNRGKRKSADVRRDMVALRRETLDNLAPVDPEPAPPEAPPGHVYRRGDRVHVVSVGAEGEILEEPVGGYAAVQMGAMRASLPLSGLRPISRSEVRPAGAPSRTGSGEIAINRALHISPELTLRAMRVDEAAPLLDRYLDDAFLAGLKSVRIVHGKGTGALRRFVWDQLAAQGPVAEYRLADDPEGGSGVTVVTFKE